MVGAIRAIVRSFLCCFYVFLFRDVRGNANNDRFWVRYHPVPTKRLSIMIIELLSFVVEHSRDFEWTL